MKNKYIYIGVAATVLIGAGVGFYFYQKNKSGGALSITGSSTATPAASSTDTSTALQAAMPFIMKKIKSGKSSTDIYNGILDVANGYTGVNKYYFIQVMNMIAKVGNFPSKDSRLDGAAIAAINDMQASMKAKGYSDSEIQSAALKVNNDMSLFN